MRIPIIFEDVSLILIDKPSGLIVNKAENVKEITLQDWCYQKLKLDDSFFPNHEDLNNFYQRAGIVHRLDKDTSGLMLIAKNVLVFNKLQKQFLYKEITKKYLTLVHDFVQPKEGVIKAPVGRLPWNRRKFGVITFGREAETAYQVLDHYQLKDKRYSLLTVIPYTGRTHQIRIHLKYLGHSIVGDRLYAGRKILSQDQQFCPRLFLHASFLRFTHPKTNISLTFTSNIPKELLKVLSKMKKIVTS